MLASLFAIGLAILLSAMLPGQDFTLVVRNTLLASRRMGLYTSAGIVTGLLVHVAYCVLGFAVIIAESAWLFDAIRYLGVVYLLYLGVGMLMSQSSQPGFSFADKTQAKPLALTPFKAFRQGMICNVLNPKATLFFLALFTTVLTPDAPGLMVLAVSIEMLLIPLFWFAGLAVLLSYQPVFVWLNRAEVYVTKLLGIVLILFAILLLVVV